MTSDPIDAMNAGSDPWLLGPKQDAAEAKFREGISDSDDGVVAVRSAWRRAKRKWQVKTAIILT